jgi:hypothetical protein
MKIVINKCFGGFGLSDEATNLFLKKQKATRFRDGFYESDIKRNNPVLVQVVEELGKDADGAHAELKVVEIPDDIEWEIEEYDGREWVSEIHRSWS